jgi:heme/copper-type cytochrome/quinol oxidase subunit 1
MQREVVNVARGYLGIAAIGIFLGSIGALRMRYELWWPDIDRSVEQFYEAFAAHAWSTWHGGFLPAVFLGLGHIAVPSLVAAPRTRMIWLSAAGTLPAAFAAVLLTFGFRQQLTDETIGHVLALFAIGYVSAGAYFIVTAAPRLRRAGALHGAIVVAFVFALLWVVVDGVLRATSAIDPSRFGVDSPVPQWFFDWTTIVATFGAVALAVGAVARDLTAPRVPTAAFHFAALVPSLAIGLMASAFLASLSAGIHLHDTYLVTGTIHAYASVFVIATLAGLHGWSEDLFERTPHPALGTASTAFLATGTITTTIAMMVTGANGMPMRYVDYLDDFTTLHRLIGASAIVTAVGVLLSLISIAVGASASKALRNP